MESAQAAPRFGIDRLVIRGKRIFGWGWLAHPERTTAAIELHVAGRGWERSFAADTGLTRDDVHQLLPSFRDAASSGFMVTGFLPDAGASEVSLRVRFHDGVKARIDITHVVKKPETAERKLRQLSYLAGAIWRRLKRGDLGGIIRRAKAQAYGAAVLDEDGIVDKLVPALRSSTKVWLMFDHNMGGGANQYRRDMIAAALARNEPTLLCTYNLPLLEYRLHVYRPGHEEQVFRISSFLFLEPIFEALSPSVFVNSPVSFEDPLALAEWLATMRARYPHSSLAVTVHDYYAACPSFVLLDADGRHCGVPPQSACERCLPRHGASYVSLSPPTDIATWRASWARCLAAADEIRCFSAASQQLLRRAFPALASARLTLVPHRIDFTPRRPAKVDSSERLVIGVFGEISAQKGAHIVVQMVQLIEQMHVDADIVVVGSLDVPCDSARLRVTGRYRREQLPDLVERHGINVAFFSSVWPETFSYVVAELMALHMPVVAFDLGAPAERLRPYALGRLCGEISARAALDTVMALHAELARDNSARVA